jgi:ParB family chromosome partitioning protein
MHFNLQSLPIADIDLDDTTFQITTQTRIDDLQASIDNLGMLHPPIVFQTDSKIAIISGFRRIKACQQLGYDPIGVNLLAPGTPPLRLAQLAIADNASQRDLNLIELSRAFNLLASSKAESEAVQTVVAGLGLPANTDFIEKVKRLTRMAPAIQQGVIDRRIALPMALELETIGPEVGARLAVLFRCLGLSLSRQREVVSLLTDIAGRDNEALESVLNRAAIVDVLADSDLDRNQKIHRLRRYLKQCRYPEMSKMEAQFAELVSQLRLGRGLKLTPPRYFEGPHYTLRIHFNTRDELTRRLDSAQALLSDSGLAEFLNR